MFLMFKNFICASFTGTVADEIVLQPPLAMVSADQPEKRALLCLKRRESLMNFSECTVPSRISNSDSHVCRHDSSSENDASNTRSGQRSIQNSYI